MILAKDLVATLHKAMREQQRTAQQFNQQWRAATAWQHRRKSK